MVMRCPSYVWLVVHPELLVRAIRRACLELLAKYFEDEWLRRLFTFFGGWRDLEAKHGVLLWNGCSTCQKGSAWLYTTHTYPSIGSSS
jgi:hypothetical protein